jgi:glycosyltransferase involved in cell wall biosynthesis
MHRYQPDLLARIRTDYVHEQQERYRTQLTMLEDSDFRTEVIETGLKKANEFSWEKMAQQYLDLYQSLLS